jgi:hypothetical protein
MARFHTNLHKGNPHPPSSVDNKTLMPTETHPSLDHAAFGPEDLEKYPVRVIKTEGFERLFSHYTGLHGDELFKYVQDFQTKALKVHPLKRFAYTRFIRMDVFTMGVSRLYVSVLTMNTRRS